MQNKSSESKKTLVNTFLVGSSQFINILIGLFKTKIIAVLLGPSGIGIVQLLSSSIELVRTASSFGLGFSGVRDISESYGTGDKKLISKKIKILKGWVFFSGILGVLITLILSKQLSFLAFGNSSYWVEISILSITIIVNNVSSSYSAIIRGFRRMADFAKINVFSSLITTLIVVPIYFFFKLNGIVLALVFSSLVPLVLNISYTKKINLSKVKITIKEGFFGGIEMFKLGLFTVLTALLTQATTYYVRILISEDLGLESVGYFAVATTLAVSYMGIIFTSIATDYFPKLSAINKDNEAVNVAVILQTKIVLLLGTPLILVMYTFSEFIIPLLYSKEFLESFPILMWMLLSVFLRLIGFPIGYVFLAKGKKSLFIFTQSLWNAFFLIFVLISQMNNANLEGIGMAFVGAYFIGALLNIILIKKTTNLKYDKITTKYILLFSVIVLTYFFISINYTGFYFILFKVSCLILFFIYCLKQLEQLINVNLLELIKSKLFKN